MIPTYVGQHLRRFLTRRALAAWCGTDRLSALAGPARRASDRELTPAAAPFALFVGGREVPKKLLRALHLDLLESHGLVETGGDQVRATLALLPLADGLLACDRLDAPESHDLVCWPDDSSYHLALSLPDVREGWLDLATGSGFALLARGGGGSGIDINARAVRYAEMTSELSDEYFTASCGDLMSLQTWRLASLISCNAPIPDGDPYRPLWRSTIAAFFDRFYSFVRASLRLGGLAVIHATEAALAPLADLPGERVVVAYTPEPGFAVAWWEPNGKDRYVTARRPLTPDHPHLTYADRAAVL
jgi:hypothetical protein